MMQRRVCKPYPIYKTPKENSWYVLRPVQNIIAPSDRQDFKYEENIRKNKEDFYLLKIKIQNKEVPQVTIIH